MQSIFRYLILALAATWAGVVSAQSEYQVRAGDTLTIEVLEDPSLNRSVTVLPDGRFSFPMAGTLPAAGRTIGQIQSAVTDAIARNFASSPNVYVGVQPAPREPTLPGTALPAEKPVISIYLMGEVTTAGLVEVKPGTTFLQALAQSGGLTPFAATKRVQLRRTDPASRVQRVYKINYRALTQGAALSRDIRLQEGDVILVPERRLFE